MLLFPVKLGPGRAARSPHLAVASALLLAACGYRSAYASGAPDERLTVAGAELASPHVAALEAALAGTRAELLRHGALAAGTAYPRVVVELVRVDEVGVGIRATPGPGPLATGASVGVTARAWVVARAGAEPERSTGDVRRIVTVAQGGDALADREAFEEAALAAARLTGEGLASRVLGIVEPAVEPM